MKDAEQYQHYLDCKQAVEADAALTALIAEREALVARTVQLAASWDYNPAEAVACADDAEQLGHMLAQHPLMIALREAEAALRRDCSDCSGCCGGCRGSDLD